MRPTRSPAIIPFVGLVLVAAGGCGTARPLEGDQRSCPTWEDQVGPLLAHECTSCHEGAKAEGRYDLTSYLGALGGGTDATPNALPADSRSAILSALDPPTATAPHKDLESARAVLASWVECRLPYARRGVHEPGILDPKDPNGEFHGDLIKNAGWSFKQCQKCHGEDFKGAASGVSCYTCHKKGPTDCETCHGTPPKTGAHEIHTRGRVTFPLDCNACHVKPMVYTDVGHLFREDGSVDQGPADVVWNSLAKAEPEPNNRGGAPQYDRTSKVCSNVYCHGATFVDTKNSAPSPRWEPAVASERCDLCHGMAPSSHASDRCADCHGRVADLKGALRADALKAGLHLDGEVSVGENNSKCYACHGMDETGVPPRVLGGTPEGEADKIVGAHKAHLTAPQHLRAPLGCADCHLVPKDLHSPGHIDSAPPAEVFPNAPSFSSLATADGANATFSRDTWSCANVYCHGGGKRLQSDTAPGLAQNASWLGSAQAVRCGACHGVPPKTVIDQKGTIHPQVALDRCYQCHPNTVDQNGNIIITGAPGMQTSRHINGVVDTP